VTDSSSSKRGLEDALLNKIRRTARRARWSFTVTGGTVWFDDGTARTKASVQALASDFENTLLQVSVRLNEARSAQTRPVPRHPDSFKSVPWHEFDLSGRHISTKG
jgi:hypothetical protein